ncbi:MAG: hypothetical protein AB7U47_13065 [Variibacter sp.]
MIAAYLFVLQTLLAGIVVTQAAAASPADLPTILCAEHTAPVDSGPTQPSKAPLCEHCVACVVAAVATPAPETPAATILRFAHAAIAPTIAEPASSPARRIGLHTSRGPPRSA